MLSGLRKISVSEIEFCVGSEPNFKSSGAVIERLDSKGLGRSFQEFVKVISNVLREWSSIGARFNGTVKLVCRTRPSFVQVIQHLRESPVRNWLHETAVPKPILGQRTHLECAMDHSSPPSTMLMIVRDKFSVWPIACLILSLLSQMIRRFCRCETFTRYVPANTGSFLKSLESDVVAFQEQPINCKQAN
jgi:hypothetical protein